MRTLFNDVLRDIKLGNMQAVKSFFRVGEREEIGEEPKKAKKVEVSNVFDAGKIDYKELQK